MLAAKKNLLFLTLFVLLVLLEVTQAIRPIIHKRRHRIKRSPKHVHGHLVRKHQSGAVAVVPGGTFRLGRASVRTRVSKLNAGTATFFANDFGSCDGSNGITDLVVAISQEMFAVPANPNASQACGRRILAKGPKGTVTVTVSDQCHDCATKDLDLSQAAFERIADPTAGHVEVQWSFLD